MGGGKFTRLYRRIMAETLSPLGFRRKGSVFWRERDSVLHLIAVDRSPFDGTFTVDIAIQALVFPYDAFDLSLGGRLDQFAPSTFPSRWDVPANDQQLVLVLRQFAEVVLRYAIPWLERFQSTRHIVDIYRADNWSIYPPPGGGPISRALIVGLCALDAELFDTGRELLSYAYSECYARMDTVAPEWTRKRKRMVEGLLGLLERGQREDIRQHLEEYKAGTRAALGVDENPIQGAAHPGSVYAG
ncbi:MAG: DUF4304 domain-containing protein [Chloroflexi bacterium]|nr:DUF4304 domain-containing protein [Chloroflexota bacterium]